MYTLDASVFVRDLSPGDPDHAICQELLEQLRVTNTRIIAPFLLLAEVAGALSREFRDPMRGRLAVELLRDLPNLTLVALDQAIAQEAAELAADYGLRGADASYVAIARRYGCRLATTDRDQRERATIVVPALTPAEALAALRAGGTAPV